MSLFQWQKQSFRHFWNFFYFLFFSIYYTYVCTYTILLTWCLHYINYMHTSTEQEVQTVELFIIACLMNELWYKILCSIGKNRLIVFNTAIHSDSLFQSSLMWSKRLNFSSINTPRSFWNSTCPSCFPFTWVESLSFSIHLHSLFPVTNMHFIFDSLRIIFLALDLLMIPWVSLNKFVDSVSGAFLTSHEWLKVVISTCQW